MPDTPPPAPAAAALGLARPPNFSGRIAFLSSTTATAAEARARAAEVFDEAATRTRRAASAQMEALLAGAARASIRSRKSPTWASSITSWTRLRRSR